MTAIIVPDGEEEAKGFTWVRLVRGPARKSMRLLSCPARVLLDWMIDEIDGKNSVWVRHEEVRAELGLTRSAMYRSMSELRALKLVAQYETFCWYVSPRLVYSGDRRKWSYARHVFDTLIRQQQETPNEPSDLQARSGQADDPPSDPVAQP